MAPEVPGVDLCGPELVIFDVDGTLNGVELWWPELLRKGLREFAEAEGLQLTEPDDRAALSVVGQQDSEVWSPFLPLAQQHRWSALRARVLPMEIELLCAGRDYLYPGVRDLLAALRAAGVKLALASNCGAEYMRAITHGQGLAGLTDWQFCLDSPGVREKADMLRSAMRLAATSDAATSTVGIRAVMIGDRASDHAAAVAVGVPFIWRENDLCTLLGIDGRWNGDPDQLLALLGLPGISSVDIE